MKLITFVCAIFRFCLSGIVFWLISVAGISAQAACNGNKKIDSVAIIREFQQKMLLQAAQRTNSGNATGNGAPMRISAGTLPAAYDYYVSTAGSDSNPGTQVAPLRTVQAAINKSVTGQAVKVADGRYVECIDFMGKSIRVVGNPGSPSSVIIDGNRKNATVRMTRRETSSTLLCGFTITGGSGHLVYLQFGGGIHLYDNANPVLSDLIITGNRAASGAALGALHGAAPTVRNVLIYGNHSTAAGYPVHFHNLITGAAMYNTTIVNNTGAYGAIAVTRGCSVTVKNSIIRNPQATCEIKMSSNDDWINSNSITATTVDYCNIRGGTGLLHTVPGEGTYVLGAGIIDADPVFADAFMGRYQLATGSPCIDAGDPSPGWNDVNMPPCRGTERNDLGMYGWQVSAQSFQEHVDGLDYPEMPDTYSTDPEGIGAIAGTFNVSSTGAAAYAIPIECPPGTGGMQPQIAITYSSQAGNGIAGWGCSLSGISAITRAPKTVYHDYTAAGITHGEVDAFLLDGQRLIHDNTVNNIAEGKVGAVYYPENDPLTRVIIMGNWYVADYQSYSVIDDERWFKVERGGMIFYYGRAENDNTGNSRQKYSKMAYSHGLFARLEAIYRRINTWYIGYAEDVHGNRINYDYETDRHTPYLKTVSYGKNVNATTSLENTITFAYETRPDSTHFLLENEKGAIRRRLTKITTKTGNEIYREYHPAYSNADYFSRLTSVTEKNGAGETLKPTAIQWSNLPAFSQNSSIPGVKDVTILATGIPHSDQSFTAADLNGDGISDLVGVFAAKILVGTGPGSVSYDHRTYAYVYWGALNASGNPQFTTATPYQIDNSFSFDGWKQQGGSSSPIDFDGNGINELVMPYLVNNRNITFRFISGETNNLFFGGDLECSSEMPLYTTGDMDNDGKGDVIMLEKGHNGSNLYPCKITGHIRGTLLKPGMFNLPLPSKPEKLFVFDFNGDGMSDVLVFYNGGYTVFWNQGNGISNQTLSGSNKTAGTIAGNAYMLRMGDFNGDGLPDFIVNATDDRNWYFEINRGDGTFVRQLAYTFNDNVCDHGFTDYDGDENTVIKFGCLVFDFDFDGKSDVVIHKAIYDRETNMWNQEWGKFRTTQTYWMRSTGSGLHGLLLSSSSSSEDVSNRFFVTGDFNGDGQTELMNYGYNVYGNDGTVANTSQVWRMYKNPGFSAQSGKVTSITSGAGNSTSITYASLVTGGIYTKGTGAAYPVMDVTPPLHAVKKVTYDNGAAGTMTENYTYAGMKFHAQGKGLLGMMKKTVTNTTFGSVAEEGITTLNTTWFVPSETYSKTTAGGKTAETKLNFTIVDKGSKKIFAYPNRKTETDLDGNTVTAIYGYDEANGYLLRDSAIYGNSMYRVTRYGDYTLAGGRHQPRLITSVQKHADDGSPFTRKTRIQYDPGKGYPVSKIDNYGSPMPLTTEYTGYDAFGNCTSYRVGGSGVSTVTYHNGYDATGRFIDSTYTSPASAVVTFTYDTWGNVLTETDATNPDNQLTTVHTYDGWGRKKYTTTPEGLKTAYNTGWNSSSAAKTYFTVTRSTGQPWVKTWYDRVGRETETETVGPKGISIAATSTYNSKGQVTQTQNMRGNLTITETFTYDGHGRLTSQSSTGGQSAAYSYGNRSRTTVIDGRSYTKTYDAWGSVKSSGDPVNTVQYTYHSSGQPKTVTSAGATFSMTYDGIGNQTTLTDPNAGTTTYTYDAAGQARTQTAGNGAVTLIHRDRLGRDSCIIQGNIRTAYTYGTAGNATGRLTKLQTGNNYAAYTYDQYGRPMTEKRNIDGAGLFELSYAYNSTGQLQKTVYPGGIQVGNEYDAYGNLMKVLAGTQPVWELAGETGTLTTTTLGGSMTATETFNAQGQLASLKTVKGNTQIRNMNFEFFAPTGNLTSRTGMIDQKEGFFYDDLDRLIAVSHEKSGTTNTIAVVDYADNGNINEKTGLGEYTYADTRPHAVEYLENTDLLFSTGQKIDYNAFRKATVLKDTIDGDAFQMDIAYGPDEQRWKTVLQKNGSVVKTVIFAGDYERITEDGITKELIYLPGGGIYVRQAGQADKEYYAHTDHLGSIISITDGNGNDVFKASYDAWGRQTITNNTFKFHRGYTGHEHLPEFGLINMNGRMYDPIVGRFLSPDPYVQMPDFSQSFNRYSYCINNPLIYTDPTGEVFGIDDAIFILASMYMAGIQSNFFHAAENGGNPFNPGNWNWNSPWTYVSIAAGGFSAYAQTLEHCEYAVDLATGKKFFMSHKGEGIQDYLHYGRWVDNHSAFITDYTVIKDIALGGVDNIRNLASGIYTGQQAINMAAGTVRMSRHEQIMSNPVVQSIHRAQGEFWSTIGSFINSVSHGVLNPDHIPQYVGGTAPIPGRFRGGGLLKGAAKTGTQTVYKGVDAAGKVRYVGRTGRDAAVRFGEHARSGTSRSLLDYRVVETGLTTPQARIWEQNMINSLGLQKNGGQLFNQINSIAPKYWWQYGIK